jgi:hypothetical protein
LGAVLFFRVNFVISQSGDDPQEDLAKFGYNLNMIKKNPLKSFLLLSSLA